MSKKHLTTHSYCNWQSFLDQDTALGETVLFGFNLYLQPNLLSRCYTNPAHARNNIFLIVD